jgi:uncharacterized protein YcnI
MNPRNCPGTAGAARRLAAVLSLCSVALLAVPVLALAHAVVFPRTSAPGAFERYVLRVPNEKTSPTTRVEIHFPTDVRVTAFEDVPGWTLEVLTDSAKRVMGAVWTGTLPPQRFVEFPFMAANPKSDGKIVWPAYQTYADGERVEWTGEEGSKRPASVTTLAPGSAGRSGAATWVPWTALGLALVSLGLAARPSGRTRTENAPGRF